MAPKSANQKQPKSSAKEQTIRRSDRNPEKKVVNFAQNEKKLSSKKNTVKQTSAVETKPKLTRVAAVTPMLLNISIKGRVISVWRAHRLHQANTQYSFECVFQNQKGDRIQLYIKTELMCQFAPLLKEGVCYVISNFGVIENSGKKPLLPHKWKISFYKNTTVTRIDDYDENVSGFKLEPFSRINDTDEEYPEKNSVDVIGTVVGIGPIVAVNSLGPKKIRRTIVLENEEGEKIDLTFWDDWTKKWDKYAQKMNNIGYIDVMMQLGKVNYFNNVPAVHNAIFGTKLFINQKLPELVAFRERYESREEYDSKNHKIELVTDEVKVVTPQMFMQGAVKKLVGCIRDTMPDTECVIYAAVHSIQYDSGWAYKGCKICSTKVVANAAKGPSSSKAQQPWWCPRHEGQDGFAYRFKILVRVADENDNSAQLCIFDGSVHRMSGYTAWQLVEKYGPDVDTYFPQEELDTIIGKPYLFKIKFSEFNVKNNSHVYRCEKVSNDENIIDYWKNGFYGDMFIKDDSDCEVNGDSDNEFNDDSENEVKDDSDNDLKSDSQQSMEEDGEQEITTPCVSIKSGKSMDLSLTRRLNLHTPSSELSYSSTGHTSGSGSGSTKKRQRTVVLIDLSDSEYDTDCDEQEANKKKQMVASDPEVEKDKADKIVRVKVEKLDDHEKDESTNLDVDNNESSK